MICRDQTLRDMPERQNRVGVERVIYYRSLVYRLPRVSPPPSFSRIKLPSTSNLFRAIPQTSRLPVDSLL